MKRITLTMLFAVIAGTPALAQEPPVPPTPPARPAPAVPAPMPAPAPRVYPTPAAPMAPIDRWDIDIMRDQALEMSRIDRETARMNADLARINGEAARMAGEAVRMNADVIRDAVREANRNVERMNIDAVRDYAAYAPMAALAPMTPMAPMPAIAPMAVPAPAVYVGDNFHFRTPPAPWAQGDPADSLYRVASNALTNGDYGRAAKLFSDLAKNYSKSVYATSAPYYEATARYRIGTTDELRTAAGVLEPLVAKIPAGTSVASSDRTTYARPGGYGGRNASDAEVLSLYARINGALAQRGDRGAADKVSKLAAQGGTRCDQEDAQVKIEALNALSQMDATKASPYLRSVLDQKGECSTSLRRNAVFMLGRRTDAESANLLMSVAKSDPDYGVRTSAIDALSHVQSEAAFSALEDLLRNDQDERIQRSVVSALMRSDNAKARNSMRALIDRKDAPVNLRIEAIQSFNSDRTTAEDGAYLRGLYPKAESDNLKRAIIDAVSRMGGSDNEQWVLALAKNPNESSQIRSQAISRMMGKSSITITEVAKLYDAADNRNMRTQLINVFRSRREPEAADKLVDIAKNGTDFELRRQAISALMSRNDPRSQQLFIDILEGKKP